ncbi:MAG: hypothetical protein LBD37_07085 [Treponema sp.]|nr:hypothetical protein [Treponema sp.]
MVWQSRLWFLGGALFLLTLPLFPYDFGLLADQTLELEASRGVYKPVLTPWVSWNNGRGLSFYGSSAFSLPRYFYNDYPYGIQKTGDGGWTKPVLVMELSRTAGYWRAAGSLLAAGRMPYEDALGFAASGLFDGLCFDADLARGGLRLGLWYTGLLYKDSAKILMTPGDTEDYAKPWHWDNFSAYFASRRILSALRWDAALGESYRLSVEALAQFDLSGHDTLLHSQYGEILVEIFPEKPAGLTAGLACELMEDQDGKAGGAFGALARLQTEVPGGYKDGAALTVKYGSGPWNDAFAFTPLSSPAQGEVFPGSLSGLLVIAADYGIQPRPAILAECVFRYFLRDHGVSGEEGKYLYGGELWASLAWQPLEDLRLSLGGGAFFPGLGNIYGDSKPQGKLTIGLSLSF